jgi:excisionase family DNA binding protein
MPRYLVTEEVAELLRQSVRSVQEKTARGEIPHTRIAGMRRTLYVPDELYAWLAGGDLETVDLPRGGRLVRVVKDGRPAHTGRPETLVRREEVSSRDAT